MIYEYQDLTNAEFQIPPIVAKYASFMFSFIGRGVCMSTCSPMAHPRTPRRLPLPLSVSPCKQVAISSHLTLTNLPGRTVYIFLGMITCGEGKWYHWVPGLVVAIVGVGYVALEFIPSIEPPANMRDADPSWGAEQV